MSVVYRRCHPEARLETKEGVKKVKTGKPFLLIVLIVGLLVGFAVAPAGAQVSNAASAGIWATIVKSLTVTKADDLRFGQIAPGAQACTVVLSPLGARHVTAGDCMLAFGEAFSAAKFVVDGSADENFSISFVAPGSVSNGLNEMTISDFTADVGTGGTLDANGEAEFTVGATLAIAAGQPQGLYEGDFTVTVEYE